MADRDQTLQSCGRARRLYREFVVNKRDHPLVPQNLPAKHADMLPVLSQYTSAEFGDLALPPVVDYQHALAMEDQRYDLAEIPDWESRFPAAIFRGAATGRGVTWKTNARLRLCALSKTWYDAQTHSPPLLDARLTSWNPRHKWGSSNALEVIDPSSAAPPLTPRNGASRKYFLPMSRQNNWKYYVLVDGNVGASRLGELARRCFLLLWVRTSLPQVSYADDSLVAWTHYVPIRENLADLESKLHWARSNDASVRRMAEALRDTLLPTLKQTAIDRGVARTISSLPSPLPPDRFRNAMLWLWNERRSGIYVLMSPRGRVLKFAPFANASYCNDWNLSAELVGPFLVEARRLWPSKERVLEDTSRWWSNGALVCNVMPRGIWGEAMMSEIYAMLRNSGQFF